MNAEDIKKTINKIVSTQAITKQQRQLFLVGKFLLRRLVNKINTTRQLIWIWDNAPAELTPATLRESVRDVRASGSDSARVGVTASSGSSHGGTFTVWELVSPVTERDQVNTKPRDWRHILHLWSGRHKQQHDALKPFWFGGKLKLRDFCGKLRRHRFTVAGRFQADFFFTSVYL